VIYACFQNRHLAIFWVSLELHQLFEDVNINQAAFTLKMNFSKLVCFSESTEKLWADTFDCTPSRWFIGLL